jgi:hypothetical protein
MVETWKNWYENSYERDLLFGLVCLIAQYLLLLLYLECDFGVKFATLGFGISTIITLLRCRSYYKKFRQEILIKESWWKLKEYGGYI